MIMTPIKAFSGSEETGPQRPLLGPEGKSAAPGSHLSSSSGGGGEAESGSSLVAEGDLTGQFTRVMGKGELQEPRLRWGTGPGAVLVLTFLTAAPRQSAPSCWCPGRTRTTSAATYS